MKKFFVLAIILLLSSIDLSNANAVSFRWSLYDNSVNPPTLQANELALYRDGSLILPGITLTSTRLTINDPAVKDNGECYDFNLTARIVENGVVMESGFSDTVTWCGESPVIQWIMKNE